MKPKFIAILICSFCLTSVLAQDYDNSGKKKDLINAQKIAFITKNLELTPEEAQAFWPVFNEFQKKAEELLSEKRTYMKKVKLDSEGLSEKESEELSDKIIEIDLSEAKLRKDYHVKFKKVLPKVKVLKLYKTEHLFKRQLLHDIRGGKGKGHGYRYNNESE